MRVGFRIDGSEMTAGSLDHIRPFLADIDRFDSAARETIRDDFIRDNDSTNRLHLSHHLDEFDKAARQRCFGTDHIEETGVDQLLAALRLVSIGLYPDGERQAQERKSRPRVVAVFDYAIAASDYRLAAKFGPRGKIVRLAMES